MIVLIFIIWLQTIRKEARINSRNTSGHSDTMHCYQTWLYTKIVKWWTFKYIYETTSSHYSQYLPIYQFIENVGSTIYLPWSNSVYQTRHYGCPFRIIFHNTFSFIYNKHYRKVKNQFCHPFLYSPIKVCSWNVSITHNADNSRQHNIAPMRPWLLSAQSDFIVSL